MKNIVFIAPPAAGKGTQSLLLQEKYHLAHISTGDLLRKASQEESERGYFIKEALQKGQLVSDEITLELLTERLKEKDCESGYILDGFPRNVKQALAYENVLRELGKDLGYVFFLDCPKELLKKRIVGREICPNCGAVFNSLIEESKPSVEGVCDRCSHTLIKRKDDNEQTFDERYDIYMKQTEPLIHHYRSLGVLHTIKEEDKDVVFKKIEEIIHE